MTNKFMHLAVKAMIGLVAALLLASCGGTATDWTRGTSEMMYTGLDSISFRMLNQALEVISAANEGASNYEIWNAFQVCDDDQGANAAPLPWSAAYASLGHADLAAALNAAILASNKDFVCWTDEL